MALEQQRSNLQALEAEEQELKSEEQELDQRLKDLECEKSDLQNRLKRKRDEINEQKKWVKLEELCDSLRRNDESLAENPTQRLEKKSQLPAGYVKSLCEALLENTTVTTISIFPAMLLPINFFDIHTDIGCRDSLAYIDPLIRYVRTSASLRHVIFCSISGSSSMPPQRVDLILVPIIVDAVRNNSSVDSLTISYPIRSSLLSSALRAMTLTTLNIDLDHLDCRTSADVVNFESSFECMTTLQHLTLSGIANEEPTKSILACLAHGCASLLDLKLSGDFTTHVSPAFWMALSQVFYSATMLRHLELDGFKLDRAAMEGLITCLRLPDDSGPSPSTISKLSFCRCEWRSDARKTLIELLRIEASSEDGQVHASSLREVYGLEAYVGLATVLASSRGALAPTTIGSQLHTVSLNGGFPWGCANEFIGVSKRIHLRCLRLNDMRGFHCSALQRCLRHVSSIRELHVSLRGNDSVPVDLYPMVEQNEHLCVFSATNGRGDQLFSTARRRRLDACCQRNQFLIQLSTGRRWDDGDEHVERTRTPLVLDTLHFPLVARTAMRLSRRKLLGIIALHDQSSG